MTRENSRITHHVSHQTISAATTLSGDAACLAAREPILPRSTRRIIHGDCFAVDVSQGAPDVADHITLLINGYDMAVPKTYPEGTLAAYLADVLWGFGTRFGAGAT
ncbi:MAG: hypothetical protein BroJett015_32520 [Chloroflexota bacterium]|nr:hypothetical protein [Ardenticatenaceae bacterium]GIK57589.1 MAG: hypothetical protein BroJett015_32520 [Chloroflexota bacterium]